ncbi:tRNA uridine-5-carboxymethylaminomethyl(34) synthesis enzyme MnmG [Anaerotignum sp. MSJ-24]|uniref:tRNA uridine-5-carboxymethylaminomethyl(34) synthesis enzyme MnmG n=1 Tax=Anaerotignum sp. MSJ-24 TaxID=2841521 RepID=UPI001C1254AB|nr:tRNA uridine-5-carboxymethylaminomethyl(34) synthesis enzyme MnmG [Anaerotignum sp. MSJ-24]MBU5463922.1 tRNA uridine-5-carboxymethylaminomethyl(34) synthesis enzyme MnmG [Anaerotignum sp. MSJ-24]
MSYIAEEADVIVVGGGHAGCEAALASARMGLKTIIFAISLDSIAMMPCNPSIGGSSKGHLVREVDALGGEMGKNIDKTYIQTKMLNTGKGPAVYSLRAQADKGRYQREMKRTLEKTENLYIRQGEVTDIIVEDNVVKGVKTSSDAIYNAKAVVLCVGTYLKARCLYGETIIHSGPNGLMPATKLSQSLLDLGITLYRFKTGTPARIDRKTMDFSKMIPQYGDENIVPFSFENTPEDIKREQVLCYLTYTNENTHNLIRENLHRSAMYGGLIQGTGPRYCPSIEDKVVKFADKEKHQIFIEPEGENTDEMYIQGMSTSLPEEVQVQMYRTVPGLENCRIMRTAYAIEYDCIDATQLKLSLEFKNIHGLFGAGQFNGSSGYEEAAAQGLIGGINAAQYVKGEKPLILDRSEAYIGVLIDDLVTRGSKEPYRMMTSRAEYRLLLRQDNADERLTEKAYNIGLISEERYNKFLEKERLISEEIERVENVRITPKENVLELLDKYNSTRIKSGVKLSDLIKRPELDYFKLSEIDNERPELAYAVQEEVNIKIKYEGYIKQQINQVNQFKKMENKLLPADIDYNEIKNLRIEATQKLNAIRPASIGQASRITGVSPADITVLLIYLEQMKHSKRSE